MAWLLRLKHSPTLASCRSPYAVRVMEVLICISVRPEKRSNTSRKLPALIPLGIFSVWQLRHHQVPHVLLHVQRETVPRRALTRDSGEAGVYGSGGMR